MQVSERRNLSPISVLRRVLHEEGWPGLFEGLPGQIIKGFWVQRFLLMFKDRVGAVIIAVYLCLRRYWEGGDNLSSLIEEGKRTRVHYSHPAREQLPLNMSDAKELLSLVADTAQQALHNPIQMAEKVVETVSEEVVKVANTARDALRGTDIESAKDLVKDAVDSAKGEVKGVKVVIEQAKKK